MRKARTRARLLQARYDLQEALAEWRMDDARAAFATLEQLSTDMVEHTVKGALLARAEVEYEVILAVNKAKSGARGKAQTKIVIKPYWITISRYS